MIQKKNIHFLQHVSYEGLGLMENWFLDRGHRLSRTAFYSSAIPENLYEFPSQNDFDWLVIMGGPMGVYEEDKYPWLVQEKKFIAQSIEANKPVLGFCLGAQLIVSALGGKVYPHIQKEIGWHSISFTASAPAWLTLGKNSLSVFHWHGDTFNLPEGAELLASSSATLNQAFLFKDRVLGLQCHLETDKKAIEGFLPSGENELTGQGFCQTKDQILSQAVLSKVTQSHLYSILTHLESTF